MSYLLCVPERVYSVSLVLYIMPRFFNRTTSMTQLHASDNVMQNSETL